MLQFGEGALGVAVGRQEGRGEGGSGHDALQGEGTARSEDVAGAVRAVGADDGEFSLRPGDGQRIGSAGEENARCGLVDEPDGSVFSQRIRMVPSRMRTGCGAWAASFLPYLVSQMTPVMR